MKLPPGFHAMLPVLLIGVIALLSITQLASYESITHAQSTAAGKPALVFPKSGHTESISSITYSPDGRILASGSADNTIRLWLVDAGISIKTLIGHSSSVESIAFSPDGKVIASGSDDQTIRLWDVATGTQIRTLSGHSGAVLSVAFSSDGKAIASSSDDKTVKLWGIATEDQPRSLEGHSGAVLSVAFSPDGKVIASSSADQTVILWEAATGSQLHSLKGHKDKVSSVAFSPDGKTLASGSWDQSIRIWEVKSGNHLTTLTWHSSVVTSVAFSPNGKLLASGSEDKTIKLWDVAMEKELRTLKDHSKGVTSVIFNRDGGSIASGSKDKTIDIWNTADGSLQKTLKRHAYEVSSVAYSPDGTLLACGSYDNTVKIWDLRKGELTRLLTGHTNTVTSVAFGPTGRTLASGSADNTVKLWAVTTGREVRTLAGHRSRVTSVEFSPDEGVIASGSVDRTIKLWEVATGRELGTLMGHSAPVSSVTFSADGKTLASGGLDNKIKLWEVASRQELRTLTGHSDSVNSVAFSGDGKTIASGSRDKTIKLWDVVTGQELRTLAKHSASIISVAFSADRKTLASGSQDLTVVLWNVVNGQEISTLKGHSSPVLSVAFSPDGRQLASAGRDAAIKLWSVESREDLATLIAVDDRDWIVVDKEERFDASSSSERLMYWSIGNRLITLDQLKDRYYEPGLLRKVLDFSKEPLRSVSALPDIKLFPDVDIQPSLPDSGMLNIKLSNRGGGIGKVQVFVNDKELISDARPPGFDPDQVQAVLSVNVSGAPVIPGQNNEIRVVAHDREGNLSSQGTKFILAPKGTADSRPPDLYAIVVGISAYSSPKLDLLYAAKGAGDVAKSLELGAKRLFGVGRVHLQLLSTDKSDPRVVMPTKANIRKAFMQVRKAKPQDVLVVYLAGHGLTVPKSKDVYFYLTQEARTVDSAALADPTLQAQTTISSEELVEWIKRVPALKQAMILDTAEAGAAVDFWEQKDVSSLLISAIGRLKDRTGTHVLMGNAPNEASYEATQYGRGLLTYALLQGMRGAALRAHEYVDVERLFQYAADQVPQLARGIRATRRPLVMTSGLSFDIGRLTAEDQAAIPLAVPKPLVLRPIFINEATAEDDLGLTPYVRKGLEAESFTTKNSRISFVDVDALKIQSAIRPSGIYKIDGTKVKLRLKLFMDNRVISEVNVEGATGDLKGLIALVTETIIQEITDVQQMKNKRQSSNDVNRRQLPSSAKFTESETSEKISFISYDFHHSRANISVASSPSSFVVVRPMIRNSRTELGDDLQVQDEVVKGLRAWAEDRANSVSIEFKDVDELQGAYKFEGTYERTVKGYLRLTLAVKLNGAIVAQPTPSVCDTSDKTRIADLFVEMAQIAIGSLSADRGTREVPTAAELKVLNYPLRSYALFIATNDYDDDTGWQDLANPICDAEAIRREMIEHYGFSEEDVSTAYNQDYDGMWNSIDAYRNKVLPADSDTALFVFIAGHGTYDEQRKKGMLATRNAKMGDERGSNFYRFSNLLDDISSLAFGHIFVVIDACQSGDAIFDSTDRGDVRSDAEFLVDKLKDKPTRKAFTSASYNNVPDGPRGGHSPFAERLLEAFRTYGNNDRFLTLDEIWTLGGMDRLKTSPKHGWFKDNAPGSDFLFIARPKAKEYKCPAECSCN